jgi:hypothetical protein
MRKLFLPALATTIIAASSPARADVDDALHFYTDCHEPPSNAIAAYCNGFVEGTMKGYFVGRFSAGAKNYPPGCFEFGPQGLLRATLTLIDQRRDLLDTPAAIVVIDAARALMKPGCE